MKDIRAVPRLAPMGILDKSDTDAQVWCNIGGIAVPYTVAQGALL